MPISKTNIGFDQFHEFLTQESVVDEELATVGLHTRKPVTRSSEFLREAHVREAKMSLFTGEQKPAKADHRAFSRIPAQPTAMEIAP